MLPRFTMIFSSRFQRVAYFTATLLVAGGVPLHAGELQVREFPRAAASSISGLNFTDQPKQLPIDTRFSEAIQTIAFDLDMSCRQIEAYGWTLKPNEQERVDKIFTDSASDLTHQGYLVKPQNPASAAADITVYTATRPASPNDHILFMWSAGDAGLLLLTCDAKGSGNAPETTSVSADTTQPSFPDSAPYIDTNPTKLVGEWMGRYTCRSQGITGATLTITKAKLGSNHDNHHLDAVFSFYPTPLNQSVASGSYHLNGTYDEDTQQAYFTPGTWSQHPPGYTTNPLMVYFDVQRGRLSGIFQDTTGCTSFEAELKKGSATTAGKEKKTKAKKKAAKKNAAPAKVKVTEPTADTTLEPLSDNAATEIVTVPETSGDSTAATAPTTATVVDAPVAEAPKVEMPAAAPIPAPTPTVPAEAPAAPAPAATVTAPAATPVTAPQVPTLALPPSAPQPAAAPVTQPTVPATPEAAVSNAPKPTVSTTSTTIVMPTTKTLIVPQQPSEAAVVDVAPKEKMLDDAINNAVGGAVDNSVGGLAIPPAKTPTPQQ